jgi:hypothetical protein
MLGGRRTRSNKGKKRTPYGPRTGKTRSGKKFRSTNSKTKKVGRRTRSNKGKKRTPYGPRTGKTRSGRKFRQSAGLGFFGKKKEKDNKSEPSLAYGPGYGDRPPHQFRTIWTGDKKTKVEDREWSSGNPLPRETCPSDSDGVDVPGELTYANYLKFKYARSNPYRSGYMNWVPSPHEEHNGHPPADGPLGRRKKGKKGEKPPSCDSNPEARGCRQVDYQMKYNSENKMREVWGEDEELAKNPDQPIPKDHFIYKYLETTPALSFQFKHERFGKKDYGPYAESNKGESLLRKFRRFVNNNCKTFEDCHYYPNKKSCDYATDWRNPRHCKWVEGDYTSDLGKTYTEGTCVYDEENNLYPYYENNPGIGFVPACIWGVTDSRGREFDEKRGGLVDGDHTCTDTEGHEDKKIIEGYLNLMKQSQAQEQSPQ